MSLNNIPKFPSNYILTHGGGIMPNPEIPDAVRELHSNYFMVKHTRMGNIDILNERDKTLTAYLEESRDYEDPEDDTSLESDVTLEVKLSTLSETTEFREKFEAFAEKYQIPLLETRAYDQDRTYVLGDSEITLGIQQVPIATSPFSVDIQEEFYFTLSRTSQYDMLISLDMLFDQLNTFAPLFAEYGVDTADLTETVMDIDEDDIYFRHEFSEVPRDFWETTEEYWRRLPLEELEPIVHELADRYLDSLKQGGDEKLIAKSSLDQIQKIYQEKKNDA
jgi:hypothetical protein